MYPTRYRSIARTIEHVSQKLKRANAIERKTLIPIPKRNPWYFTQVEVDLLATFSMNDFIPKSWVWVTLKSPEAQVFQFFLGWKTDGNWLLVEKMRQEIDMYDAWFSTANRGFSRWSKGRASDISRTRGNRFHFQWNESSCFPGKCLFSTNSRSRWRGTLCWAEMRCNFLR